MDPTNKIIVALDVKSASEAKRLASELSAHVGAVKVGMELAHYAGAPQIVQLLKAEGAKIFFDGKFKDIPNTVAGAARAVTEQGVWMFNVHTLGGKKMMETAVAASDEMARAKGIARPLILGVTILTSMNVDTLKEIGFSINNGDELKEEVVRLARLAKSAGLDGVVASPNETALIRAECGKDFLIVTPGVRPLWAAKGDQERVMTPLDAVKSGADYLVIGRPITNPPADIGGPKEAAARIVDEITGSA